MSLTTARRAGVELALSPRTLRRYANEGTFRRGRHFVRFGRMIRFDLEAIRSDLEAGRIEKQNPVRDHFRALLDEVAG